LAKALQIKFQEERKEPVVQQQRKVTAKLKLVLIIDQMVESVEDLM
jgi:hypothetical protein